MDSVELGDTTWAYRDQGQGPAVVLLHGLASDARTWDALVPELARGHRTIAIDLPGYSVRTAGGRVEEPHRLALDIEQFLVRLGVGPCFLIGHSLGGTLAMLLARAYPQRCTGLALIAPGGFGTELNPFVALLGTRAGSALLRAAYGRTASRAVRGIAGRYANGRGSTRPGAEVRLVEVMETYERLASAAARAQLRDGVQHARRSRRTEAVAGALSLSPDIPILILWGTEDLVLPPWQAKQAHQSLPWSRVELIRGAGHTPHRSSATETTARIVEFLGAEPVARRIAELGA